MIPKPKITNIRTYPNLTKFLEANPDCGLTRSHLLFIKRNYNREESGVSKFVYTDQLAEWIEHNWDDFVERYNKHDDHEDDKNITDTRIKKLEKDIEYRDLQIKELGNKNLDRQEVLTTIQYLADNIKHYLQNKLEVELPPKIVGLEVPDIKKEMSAIMNDICNKMQSPIDKWNVNESENTPSVA